MWNPLRWYLSILEDHRRGIVLVILVATVVVGSGIAGLEGGLTIAEFDADTQAAEDADYVQENFLTDSQSVTVIALRGNESLSRDSLEETLELQGAIRTNETVATTLVDERATIGTASLLVEAALRSRGSFHELTIEDKMRTFRTLSAEDIETELVATLDDDQGILGPGTTPSTLLPTDHDGTAEADARLVLVIHDESDIDDESRLAAEQTVETLVDEHVETTDAFVFGQALIEHRASEATGSTFAILGPLALLLVIGFLLLAYRDVTDALLNLVGIGLVLLWTGGVVGWADIELTQLLVAVPWLLLGLSIDYGLHVVMRYREQFDSASAQAKMDERTAAMTTGLAGVLIAIGATTVTTAGGFLSGVFGPIPAIREFGLVSAAGIVAAFLVFGGLLPALKLELDTLRNRRTRPAPVSRIRPLERVMNVGVFGATRAPVVIVLVALLVTAGGVYGATEIDTSVDRTDFYPGESPAWMAGLPGVNDTGESLQQQATFLDERFEVAGGDDQVEFLIRGEVTSADGVAAIDTIERASLQTSVVRESDGDDAVFTPFDIIERLGEFDETLLVALDETDQSGDGKPDSAVAPAFDATYNLVDDSLDPVVYRTEQGEYEAIRVVVLVQSGADAQTVASEMRDVAALADEQPDVSVTVTGTPVVTADAQTALLETLVESFLIALAVTITLLVALFWYRFGSLTLGLTTVLPVMFALGWVLGTMALLDIPFNPETAIITGIAIGLGVDYAIHVSTRFQQEREAGTTVPDALSRTVQETGGTLVVSAVTTAGALAVLLFTFVPSLQRFGLVMILVVVYALFVSMLVLPSLLVLWSRARVPEKRP